MTIIEKVQKSLSPIVGASNFHYADREDLNIILDSAQFPCAFAALIDQGTITDTVGRFHERIRLQVFFADLSEEGLTGIENERILQPQKERALAWLSSLRLSDDLTMEGEPTTGRYYINNSELDVMATAFAVDVSIVEKEGFGLCGK